MVALLQMESITGEAEFRKQLQDTLVDKAKSNMPSNVESCSMDILRNAVKSMANLNYHCVQEGPSTLNIGYI